MARSLLQAKEMPNDFWAEAVTTAVYLLNISPTKAVPNQTPFEAWTGIKPRVSHLKVFGCISYALVDSNKRSKLDSKSEKCIFVGYSTQSKAYRLYNPISCKVITSRNVEFDEASRWNWDKSEETSAAGIPLVMEDIPNSAVGITPNGNSTSSSPSRGTPSSSDSETPPRKFRSLRDIYASTYALYVAEPSRFEEASQEDVWCDAMKDELAAIEKNETWELVDLPNGKNAIGLKWVFKTKYHADGSIQRHKARLVAKGYAQEQGVDFEDTFSPVARFETVRLFLSLAAKFNWLVYQFDVKSAFLNGDLEEEVYVMQPDGFIISGKEKMVYKLRKALYGLKQAPRAWYNKINSYFQQHGFERSRNEPTLYLKKEGTNDFIVVCLYVDDIIYMGSSSSMIAEFKDSMMKSFEMTDLGLLHYFLGLEVYQSSGGIFISQRKFASDLLKKSGISECKVAPTPMNMNEKLQVEDGTGKEDGSFYRSLVGGLIYLTHTRPDIAFSVGVVSRFMHSPTKHHFGAAKRIMRYVAGTVEYGIWYSKKSECKLIGYTDSDWGGCVNDRKSTSGNVFCIGSGAVSWSSKKQATTALSTSEAEYVAATTSACQAVWLRRLLADFGQEQKSATVIYCDNNAAIAMAKNPAFHGRTKHIDLRHHFIRDLVSSEQIVLKFCSTNEQVADILTKALSYEKHVYFRTKLGVCNFESRGDVEG